jgi:4-alpha-glucanotransferase
MFKRGSGILLHISSLPSPFGIGDFGPGAYQFIDTLAQAKQQYWQILPLNPTENIDGNSPYSSPSAFAGNPLFVSPEILINEGLLLKEEMVGIPVFSAHLVDYGKVVPFKLTLLRKAFVNFNKQKHSKAAFHEFSESNRYWLDDYALFTVIKKNIDHRMWAEWPEGLKRREPAALKKIIREHQESFEAIKWIQYILAKQIKQLRAYARQKNIQLIGDIPIYVRMDSADVWTHPGLFKLDENLNPTVVAGVPPDYFSKTGQRWGNPIYDWAKLQSTGFQWWIERMKKDMQSADIVRIDHFRGLVAYWEIPAGEPTAVKGDWANVPVYELFKALKKEFPALPVIAEDLGHITDDVRAAMKRLGLPGMKILHFAFGEDLEKHIYLPHNYDQNSIVYTGTHDNNTTQGWYCRDASSHEKENFAKYAGHPIDGSQVHWDLIELAEKSPAQLAIIPMQDVLGLGQEARMNTPATTQGNWAWRFEPPSLQNPSLLKLKNLILESNRDLTSQKAFSSKPA